MDRLKKCLIMSLTLCALFAGSIKAEDSNDLDGQEESTVTIALTRLDVNDTNLELGWKIKNNTDHDVWICDKMDLMSSSEMLLAEDAETLVIRRRACIKKDEKVMMEFPFVKSLYVRLHPGQEKADAVSIDLPVRQISILKLIRASAEFAKRLVMEIGFYDEDLPGLILQIVEVNNKLNCDIHASLGDNGYEICNRFFPGHLIAGAYYNNIGLKESVASDDGEVRIPYMGQRLNGEQILRIEVDGLSIPLKEINIRSENHEVGKNK